MKSTLIPIFILVINFQIETEFSETESNQRFRKNVKNMSTKQESVSGATFKA